MVNSEGEEHEADSSQGGGAQLGGSGQVPTGTESPGTASHIPLVSKASRETWALIVPGLYSPVQQRKQQSIPYLAYVLGLSTAAAFRTWMNSEAFKPYYDDLQVKLQTVSATAVRSFGRGQRYRTRLLMVQKAIVEKISGARRYIQLPVRDDGTFDAIDWHAVFLLQAVEHNLMRPTGPFYGKNMTLDEMQARIWAVLARANLSARHRRRGDERSI
ncbi:hypothetical protein O988_03904 [Pseudogymnoascus sp. VKM F-3808]|nr:hypothetical protein O988_03904 [Pseudogymnoascus sp. VKM F-3808]